MDELRAFIAVRRPRRGAINGKRRTWMRNLRWLALVALLASPPAIADEGMWTFDNFPSAVVAEKYRATIGAAWLDQVRGAVVRLSNCTGSFVSPDGLILTNFHCARQCLAEHSTRDRSLVESGFLAADRRQEKKCAREIADTLVEMEDVTAKVAAATRGLSAQPATDARNRVRTELEQNCEQASHNDPKRGPLKCESVELYQGGQYFLYKYKRYDDVRFVFAPEVDIATFGGDPDNFQFPRFGVDVAILRAYEHGKAARTPTFLPINFEGPKAGDPIFVAGHPAWTNRLLTLAELKAIRNYLPHQLLRRSELRGRYLEFARAGETNARIVAEPLQALENLIKVRRKQLDSLHDDAQMMRKAEEESRLRSGLAGIPALLALTGDPWTEIEAALTAEEALYLPFVYLENGAGFDSALFRYARTIVRTAAERGKENGARLREYTDASLPLLEQQISAPTPVYPELEQLTLSMSLERMREWLGPDHPIVRRLLAQEAPSVLATRLIAGTALADPAVRLALWRGGAEAVDASADLLIELARTIDPAARAIRKRYEDEVDAPEALAYERIARARFALNGARVYPDATFTLRLSFGTVQGWTENGHAVDPFTRLDAAFDRATGAVPFRIPDRWLRSRQALGSSTPMNFSTSNDVVGGNSGSPAINSRGQIVGLIFDGNIHSISGAYWYDAARNRAIAVHPAIIREALTKVYGGTALYRELGGR
jgi:hypothetical protein